MYETGAPVVLVENSSMAVTRDPTSRGYTYIQRSERASVDRSDPVRA